MKKLILLIAIIVSGNILHSQSVQIGVGYGMGYYYKHLRNLDVYAMEYNIANSANLEISNLCQGPTIELVLGESGTGFLINWMMRSKTYSTGSFDIRTRVRRTGLGFKFATNAFGFGITADIGKARLQSRSGSGDWDGLYDTSKDWYLGSTLFADIYARGRFGLRIYWMNQWYKSEFGSIENYKYKFSNVGVELTAYLFRNGGDQ